MNQKVFIKQDGTIPCHRIIEELEKRGGNNILHLKGIEKNFFYYADYEDEIIGASKDIPTQYTELFYNKETDSFYETTMATIKDEGIVVDVKALSDGEYVIPEGYEAKIEDGKVIIGKKWTIDDARPGDILRTVGNNHPFIFKALNSSGNPSAYVGIDAMNMLFVPDNIIKGYWCYAEQVYPATQEQKAWLFKKLDEAGYEWDAEKLELRKKLWMPKDREKYYVCKFSFFSCRFTTEDAICNESTFKKDLEESYTYGNFFKTKEEAQAFCDKLNAAIKPIFEERKGV